MGLYIMEKISNKAVNKAGDIIRKSTNLEEIDRAILILDNWRALHSTPLRAIKMFLQGILRRKKFTNVIIVQRLKRMPSIIRKIKRFDKMAVARMQDIGGIRIILPTITDVYAAHMAIIKSKAKHIPVTPPVDYIKKPKKDGYRSLHQVFKYNNYKHPECDGMNIEVQIRTKLQHSWATAVEILGIIQNASYKTGEGGDDEKQFFRLVSYLFAKKEKQEVIEDLKDRSIESIRQELKSLNKKTGLINLLDTASKSAVKIEQNLDSNSKYFVLVLTFKDNVGVLRLNGFKYEDDAKSFYRAKEEDTRTEANKSVLMISADNVRSIKKAYPNYYLDTQFFIKELHEQL